MREKAKSTQKATIEPPLIHSNNLKINISVYFKSFIIICLEYSIQKKILVYLDAVYFIVN